jgi:endonuclease-3 related protein
MKNKIELIYEKLYEKYGPQGWWPIKELEQNSEIKNSYHKNNFDFPKTKLQEWEIIIGALLTQNTSFKQVTKAINNLYSKNILSPNKIILTDIGTIKQAIKPAGYFNQKSKRLTELAKWFLELKQIPKRCELLELNGIGPETADSILLYAFKTPSFVIDIHKKNLIKFKTNNTQTKIQ